MRLEIETTGDFLEVSRKVVTDDDFIGSYYEVDYLIRKEKLGKGNQFGKITVKSPYQELVYTIVASTGGKVEVDIRAIRKSTSWIFCVTVLTICAFWLQKRLGFSEKIISGQKAGWILPHGLQAAIIS